MRRPSVKNSYIPLKGVIYLATNKINGKIYVGQTIYPLKCRCRSHEKQAKRGKTRGVDGAINKYGPDNFKWQILEEIENTNINDPLCLTLCTKLNELEIKYIAQYKANDPSIGYNLTTGGSNSIPGDATRELMSRRKKEYFSDPKNRERVGLTFLGVEPPQKGKTWKDFYGQEKALALIIHASESHKDIHPSKLTKQKLHDININTPRTLEWNKHISEAKLGIKVPALHKPQNLTAEQREIKRLSNLAENNPRWGIKEDADLRAKKSRSQMTRRARERQQTLSKFINILKQVKELKKNDAA